MSVENGRAAVCQEKSTLQPNVGGSYTRVHSLLARSSHCASRAIVIECAAFGYRINAAYNFICNISLSPMSWKIKYLFLQKYQMLISKHNFRIDKSVPFHLSLQYAS